MAMDIDSMKPTQIKDKDLFKAAESGNSDLFKSLSEDQLLKALALRNEDGRSLLHVAVSSAHTEVVKILAAVDSSVNGINSGDEEGWVPLHSAASSGNIEIVEILLSRGANVNFKNDGGCTALHYAASKGHLRVAEILISHGAKINAKDEVGRTPLHQAASTGKSYCFKLPFSSSSSSQGLELSIVENLIQPLLIASKSSTTETALEQLIEIAKAAEGRLDLASQNIVSKLLQLCSSIPYPVGCHLLLPSLKLLRNLCAGEIRNQNAFLEQNGPEVVSTIIRSVGFASDYDGEIVRMGMQLLANFVLAGGEHQRAVWRQFFPHGFLNIARVRSREICDPLCMVIYTCCEDDDGLLADLCNEQGLPVVIEIIQTASIVDSVEKWFKLLISRICIEASYTASVFFKLDPDCGVESGNFVAEQAYILSILSEILNERIEGIIVNPDFALCILGILRSAGGVVDFSTRGKTGLPTGDAVIDVLGYSLTILRDICACDHLNQGSDDAVGMLVSSGLIELLLAFLSNLEPPAIVQKAMDQGETTYSRTACCPYQGFRRDIVAVIGNCTYGRKQVQDEMREKNGIVLLLQQCVSDEENPFLREWGIWAARNLLEGNTENQRVVADLELQRSVDVPELARLGLRVDVDPKTHRAKLVNVPNSG